MHRTESRPQRSQPTTPRVVAVDGGNLRAAADSRPDQPRRAAATGADMASRHTHGDGWDDQCHRHYGHEQPSRSWPELR